MMGIVCVFSGRRASWNTLLVCSLLAALAGVAFGAGAEFDYFLLTREWPGTFCREYQCRQQPANTSVFTIHGLWPQYQNESWPEWCDPENKFDIDAVKDLLDQMNIEWPMLYMPDFWQHEWDRHGTCALSVFSSQHEYFESTLKLHEKYDLQDALAIDGIVPSLTNLYRKSDIHASIKNNIGAIPQLYCSRDELNEIRLCVTKDLEPFDCPVQSINCPDEIKIPPFPAFPTESAATQQAPQSMASAAAGAEPRADHSTSSAAAQQVASATAVPHRTHLGDEHSRIRPQHVVRVLRGFAQQQ